MFAVPGSAMDAVLTSVAPALGAKVVIDATNDMQGSPPSSVHRITAAAPDALVFRAFNSVGWENMADPVLGGLQADLLYCGADDEAATEVVEGLISRRRVPPGACRRARRAPRGRRAPPPLVRAGDPRRTRPAPGVQGPHRLTQLATRRRGPAFGDAATYAWSLPGGPGEWSMGMFGAHGVWIDGIVPL